MKRRQSDERGFTLLEIILALAIMGTVGAIALRTVIDANTSFSETKVQQQVNEDARRMMRVLTADLRSAGFGVALNGLGNAGSTNAFDNAFESDYSATGSDGIILRSLAVGSELSDYAKDTPTSNSSILKVKSVDAFQDFEDGFVLLYKDGEFRVLQIKKIIGNPNYLQHEGKLGFSLPPGSPVYRVDQIQWDAVGERVTRNINLSLGIVGKQTHAFDRVESLKFKYIMKDGTSWTSLSQTDGAANNPLNLMCVEVNLAVYRIGGREGRKFRAELVQRVAPRNL